MSDWFPPPKHAQTLHLTSGKLCGIYFLLLNGGVVYVGSSVHILGRVGDHACDKKFNSAVWIPCGLRNMAELEEKYIQEFNPRHNKQRTVQRRTPREGDRKMVCGAVVVLRGGEWIIDETIMGISA